MKRREQADRPNVLVIVADTARADDAYATEPTIMPCLTDLGSEGTTFSNAFASAPWTLPSHAGMFTGTYSSEHGAHGDHPQLDSSHRTLAEAFAANGYETFAASNNTWISGEFGFDRGFHRFWKGWQLIQSDDDVGSIVHELGPLRRTQAAVHSVFDGNPLVNMINACYNQVYRSHSDYGAARTTDRIATWIDQRDDSRPFFAFVNYLEPHIRYQPPREFAERFLPDDATYDEAMNLRQEPRAYDVGEYELSTRELGLLRALYRGELAYVDAQIEQLRAVLQEAGAWENTITIVLGDHGENIGDHGFFGHQYNVYDTLLHVPLVATGGPFSAGGENEDIIQLVDIAPTLLDIDGIEDAQLADQQQGVSFHPAADEVRQSAFAEYIAPQPPTSVLTDRYGDLSAHAEQFDRQLRTVRTQSEKVIRGSDGSMEYYDLTCDPDERIDRGANNSERVERLTERLNQWQDQFERDHATGEVDISRGAERRLADLGYL